MSADSWGEGPQYPSLPFPMEFPYEFPAKKNAPIPFPWSSLPLSELLASGCGLTAEQGVAQ